MPVADGLLGDNLGDVAVFDSLWNDEVDEIGWEGMTRFRPLPGYRRPGETSRRASVWFAWLESQRPVYLGTHRANARLFKT